MDEMAYSEFDDAVISRMLTRKIMSMLARGLSTMDIQDYLRSAYSVDLPRTLLSDTTDRVLDDFHAWRERALEPVYPVIYLDSMTVPLRAGHDYGSRRVLIALGIGLRGQKHPLGLWIVETENRSAWQAALGELRQRGVKDILVACIYNQPGAGDALARLFPLTVSLLCMARLLEHSLGFVAAKDRKRVRTALGQVQHVATPDAAAGALMNFMCEWDDRYAAVAQLWRSRWQELTPLLALPPLWRDTVAANGAIRTLHNTLRKAAARHGLFTDQDALKIRLYLAQQQLAQRWGLPLRNWKQVLNVLTVHYGDRLGQDF